ncbi:MAG: DUF4388 domain-containing protein [Acidobacteriota bacterium]
MTKEFAQQPVTPTGAELFPIIGNLRDHFLPDLLYYLHEKRQTGTLVFALGEFKKAIIFEQGEIVFASSNLKEDSLGEALVRSGVISLTDFATAEQQVMVNLRFGEVLLQMGSIDESTLIQGLTYQMHSIIYSLFLWPMGQFRFAKEKFPTQKPSNILLSTLDTILHGTTLIRSWTQLRPKLPTLEVTLTRGQDFEVRLAKLKLHDSERRIIDTIRDNTLVSDICVLSPMNEFETCRFLVACLVIGLLVRYTPPTTAQQ